MLLDKSRTRVGGCLIGSALLVFVCFLNNTSMVRLKRSYILACRYTTRSLSILRMTSLYFPLPSITTHIQKPEQIQSSIRLSTHDNINSDSLTTSVARRLSLREYDDPKIIVNKDQLSLEDFLVTNDRLVVTDPELQVTDCACGCLESKVTSCERRYTLADVDKSANVVITHEIRDYMSAESLVLNLRRKLSPPKTKNPTNLYRRKHIVKNHRYVLGTNF